MFKVLVGLNGVMRDFNVVVVIGNGVFMGGNRVEDVNEFFFNVVLCFFFEKDSEVFRVVFVVIVSVVLVVEI